MNILKLSGAVKVLKENDLLKEFVTGKEDKQVEKISYNSKDVINGTLFICKGNNFNNRYLDEALNKGAFCYVSEKIYPEFDVEYILVNDIRKTLAVLAAWFYDYQKNIPEICAVTGTKGKSTAVYFLTHILNAADKTTAYSTTVEIFDGAESYEATLTTPESLECHKIIHTAKENRCSYFIMEVSSQAYKMERIYGLHFKYGIFVNITNDHISPNEHSDFEDYFSCKLEIVKKYENAVINLDDPNAQRVINAAKNAANILTYSIQNQQADVYARNIQKNGFISKFEIVTPAYSIETEIMIPGLFNISNALSAAAVAYQMGIDREKIAQGIKQTKVPGRMSIFERNGYTVIVDYAHNKDSLCIALKAIKEYYPDKNIVIVFGCPGNKALQRRMDMAVESAKCAEYVYITSEDPSYEDPFKIANEIRGYLNELNCPCEIIVDRDSAIKKAIAQMNQNDLVLIAGKGSEHYQVINGAAVPYGGDTVLADQYINEYK